MDAYVNKGDANNNDKKEVAYDRLKIAEETNNELDSKNSAFI